MSESIEERLVAQSNCEPGCHGRCIECPDSLAREAAAELTRLKARVEELERVAAEAHIAGLREGVELARGVQDPVLPDWRADADGRWVDDSDYDWGRQDAADRLRARADELALALKEA
jgi:hypothetical protein